MKFVKKYIPFFLSIAIVTATSTHYIDAAKKEKKKKSLFTKIKKSFKRFVTGKWKQMSKNDWLRVVGSTAVAFGSGYGFYSAFLKQNEDEPTPVEKVMSPGLVLPLSNDLFDSGWNRVRLQNNQIRRVRLRRVRVIGQRGLTCAYHAIRNSMIALDVLDLNNNLQQDIPALITHRLANQTIARWQEDVITRNRAYNARLKCDYEQQLADNRKPLHLVREDGDHLNSTEMGELLGQLEIPRGAITIYDDSGQIGEKGFDYHIQEVKNSLNKNQNYKHAFIINTLDSTIDANALSLSNGHWYAVVLNQTTNEQGECVREYFYMDSLPHANIVHRREGVWKLITALEKE